MDVILKNPEQNLIYDFYLSHCPCDSSNAKEQI